MRFTVIIVALSLAACGERAPSPAAPSLPEARVEAEVRLPAFESFTLDNGARVMLLERRGIPLVAFSAHLVGGSLADAPGREGTASLLSELLLRGAGTRDAVQFADAVDGVGGLFDARIGLESVGISGEFMSRDVDLMLELLADVLRRPHLDATEFERLHQRALQSLRAEKDGDPRGLIESYAMAWLYGEHPYARPPGGDERSLARIGHEDVTAYHHAHAGGDRLILALAGDFDAAAMRASLEEAFGDWTAAPGGLPEVPPVVPREGLRVLLVDKPDAAQTHFWIGNSGPAIGDPMRAQVDVVNTLFGGRFTSMLNTALRVESGLTYGARSALSRRPQGGSLGIVSYTATATTGPALDMALEVLDGLHASGIDPEMLESARAYMLGQFPPTLETSRQLAAQLATLALFGLDTDYVDGYGAAVAAVDLDGTRAAIDTVFPRPGDLSIVLLGKADEIRDIAAKYGEVTEMEITDATFYP